MKLNLKIKKIRSGLDVRGSPWMSLSDLLALQPFFALDKVASQENREVLSRALKLSPGPLDRPKEKFWRHSYAGWDVMGWSPKPLLTDRHGDPYPASAPVTTAGETETSKAFLVLGASCFTESYTHRDNQCSVTEDRHTRSYERRGHLRTLHMLHLLPRTYIPSPIVFPTHPSGHKVEDFLPIQCIAYLILPFVICWLGGTQNSSGEKYFCLVPSSRGSGLTGLSHVTGTLKAFLVILNCCQGWQSLVHRSPSTLYSGVTAFTGQCFSQSEQALAANQYIYARVYWVKSSLAYFWLSVVYLSYPVYEFLPYHVLANSQMLRYPILSFAILSYAMSH